MDALTALQTRVSTALLTEPGPTPEQIDELIRAGSRAPDHAGLRPWRFIMIEGDSRLRLGELLAKAGQGNEGNLDSAAIEKAKKKALRAPTIMVVVAHIKEHPKVPEIEQVITAGAAANNIVTAAYVLGIGAYWRSGSAAFSQVIKEGLGLAENEQVVGFIYMGTPRVSLKKPPTIEPSDYLTHW